VSRIACPANSFRYRIGRPPFFFGQAFSGWPPLVLLMRDFTQRGRESVEVGGWSPFRLDGFPDDLIIG